MRVWCWKVRGKREEKTKSKNGEKKQTTDTVLEIPDSEIGSKPTDTTT